MSKGKSKIEPWQKREERRRAKRVIPPRKRYLICTEGKSEAVYLKHYRSSTGPDVIPLDKSAQKIGLVKKTIEERQQRIDVGEFDEKIDEAWVVLDRDEEPTNKFDKAHFNEALALAKKNKIFIAYSNDAFELWSVLHFQDLWAKTHRYQLSKLLEKHRGKKYQKGEDIYKELRPFRGDAIRRAQKLWEDNSSPHTNPSTSIYLLVSKLINEPGFREES